MSKHRENTSRKINARKTKDLLYQSTLELINEKGYENVSINDITSRADCATGTFYLHFKSKSDVMAYCVEQYDSVAVEAYEATKDIKDFEERLISFIVEDYKRTELLGKGAIRALYGANIMQSRLIMNKDSRKVYGYFKDIFQQGKDTAVLAEDADVDQCTKDLCILLMGVDLAWSCSEEEIDIEVYAKHLISRILYGFMNKKQK